MHLVLLEDFELALLEFHGNLWHTGFLGSCT